MNERIGNAVPVADASDVVAVAAAEAIATVEDSALTPAGRICLAIKKAAARPFPTDGRRAEAVSVIREFESLMRDRLVRCDYQSLDREIEKFADQVRLLSLPLPPVDEMQRIIPQLRATGWSSLEIDLLRSVLKPHERMLACDASEIRLGTRTLTRRAIRDGSRPKSWTNLGTWEGQFERDGLLIPGEKAR